MKIKLLIHFAKDRNGGEFRRIARLSKDSDKVLECETVELVFLPIRLLLNAKKLRTNLLGVKLILLPLLLPYTRFLVIKKINRFVASYIAKLYYWRIKPDIIWGETLAGNSIAASIKGPHKYIADFHGASPEEAYYFKPNEKHFLNSNKLEEIAVKRANKLVVQSLAMKQHLINKYKLSDQSSIIVYNCGVDTNLFDYNQVSRADFRTKLGYNDSDILFVYAGGTNKWQLLEYTLDVFREVNMIVPGAKCIMLIQGDIAFYENYCVNNQIHGVRFLNSVPFKDVRNYLSICDYAWLLREDIILNRVASPTKLGEYLSSGLIVITTAVINSWEWIDNDQSIVVPLSDAEGAAYIIKKRILDNIEGLNKLKIKMREIACNNLSTEKDFRSLTKILND